jgi:cytochrome c-type biogenesis protein
MLVGASAGFAGGLISAHLDLLTRIAGVILIIFGLQMAGLIRIPWLDRAYQLPS